MPLRRCLVILACALRLVLRRKWIVAWQIDSDLFPPYAPVGIPPSFGLAACARVCSVMYEQYHAWNVPRAIIMNELQYVVRSPVLMHLVSRSVGDRECVCLMTSLVVENARSMPSERVSLWHSSPRDHSVITIADRVRLQHTCRLLRRCQHPHTTSIHDLVEETGNDARRTCIPGLLCHR